jgi:hypothetical protein
MKTLNQVKIDLLLHNVDISQIQRQRTETKIDREIHRQSHIAKERERARVKGSAPRMKTGQVNIDLL